jgi:hypothetical protein
MRSPASVGTMPEPERTRRGSPARSRSFFSDALTAGWYMPRRMAAFETLRSVNTVNKTLIKMEVYLVEKGLVSHTGVRMRLICGGLWRAGNAGSTLAHKER